MSATISDASHSASGATDRRLMVQLPPLLVRGMLTMSNCTLRHSGCRSSAQATRALISSRVAGVFAKSDSKYMSHPLRRRFTARPAAAATTASGHDCRGEMVNGTLRPKTAAARSQIERARARRRLISMAEPAPEMSADAPAGPSVRASLLVCTTGSLIVLWIAAFEMPMADVAFIFHPVLPPAILSFLACGL